MNSPDKNILFIGDGKWSHKVSRVLDSCESGYSTTTIRARDFLSTPPHKLSIDNSLKDFGYVWITTSPQMQLEVLSRFQSEDIKIIIEKPIGLDQKDLEHLEQILPLMESRLYLSEPWTHSLLWKNAKECINKLFGILDIEIVRVGNLRRELFSPTMDWLPHDIYLLVSLMAKLKLENRACELLSSKSLSDRVFLDYNLGGTLAIHLQAGESVSRQAKWRVFQNTKLALEIDFDSQTLMKLDGDTTLIEKFESDNPIVNMLENYRTTPPLVNWELLFRMYTDGILASEET